MLTISEVCFITENDDATFSAAYFNFRYYPGPIKGYGTAIDQNSGELFLFKYT